MDTRTAEPTTVGEILREEFIAPSALSLDDLAEYVGMSIDRLVSILSNTSPLNDDDAERLGEYFGTGGDFWLKLRDSHLRWRERMANAN